MTVAIRILRPGDAGELVRLRGLALLDSPSAFLASPEDDVASSEATARELLKPQADSMVFGAVAPNLIGMLGMHRARQRKAAHKINLWGMFVLKTHRQQGVAARLLDEAIRQARGLGDVASVHLSVNESALAARRMYEKAGFVAWGVEPDAMRFEGQSQNELHMRFALDSAF